LGQIAFQLLELTDTRVDLNPTAFNQLENMGARRRSNVANSEDLTNLGDAQPDGLRRTNARRGKTSAVYVRYPEAVRVDAGSMPAFS
jgi:hypothetical protein